MLSHLPSNSHTGSQTQVIFLPRYPWLGQNRELTWCLPSSYDTAISLCICFFLKKNNLKPIHCHKIFNKRVHFYKIQLNQKSFDGYSQTVLLFSWRSSKGLKHSGFWNENCHLYSFWVIVEGTRIINWDSVLPPSATESEKSRIKLDPSSDYSEQNFQSLIRQVKQCPESFPSFT